MTRFEDVSEDVLDLMRELRAEYFPDIRQAKIKVLFDLKKRMSNGKVVLGRIQKTNEIVRKLTEDDVDEGYDYIIYLDKLCWNNIARQDQIRILRHELRHIFCDIESSSPWKIIPHDIEDFSEEIELNKDDISWASRVSELLLVLYEPPER
jgi:predicted metallopeptidase